MVGIGGGKRAVSFRHVICFYTLKSHTRSRSRSTFLFANWKIAGRREEVGKKDIFVVVPMTCVRHIFLSDSLLFSFWIVSLSLLIIFCTPNVVFVVLQMMISCFLYKKFFFFIGTMVANTVRVRFFPPSFSINPKKLFRVLLLHGFLYGGNLYYL